MMVGTSQTFWPPRGGGVEVRACTWAPPVISTFTFEALTSEFWKAV